VVLHFQQQKPLTLQKQWEQADVVEIFNYKKRNNNNNDNKRSVSFRFLTTKTPHTPETTRSSWCGWDLQLQKHNNNNNNKRSVSFRFLTNKTPHKKTPKQQLANYNNSNRSMWNFKVFFFFVGLFNFVIYKIWRFSPQKIENLVKFTLRKFTIVE
jgi:hypothetical protein